MVSIEKIEFLKSVGKATLGAVAVISLATTVTYGYEKYQESYDYDTHLAGKQVLDVSNGRYNIVFYKRGCPYCHHAKKAVIKASQHSKVTSFFVDVDSSEGKSLIDKYEVKKASSIVKISGGQPEVMIYAKDGKSGKIITDYKVITESFEE